MHGYAPPLLSIYLSFFFAVCGAVSFPGPRVVALAAVVAGSSQLTRSPQQRRQGGQLWRRVTAERSVAHARTLMPMHTLVSYEFFPPPSS